MFAFVFSLFLYLYMLYLYIFTSFFFFFKQKTAYEMRISDWSSDVCSSDLIVARTDRQVAVVAVQLGRAAVHEQQFVAVGIARKNIHRPFRNPPAHAHVRVVHNRVCVPW